MVVVSIMNNEIELIRTIDHSFKNEIIKMFIKERISYLQKSKDVIFLKRCLTSNKEMYVIYVNKNQYEQASEIIKSIKNWFKESK